jgi:superfamily II DNA/RNA helicase
VKVEAQHAEATIEQRWYEVEKRERLAAVSKLLDHFRPASTLAFCNTKARCREVAAALQAQGFSALALYGELEQRERDQVLVRFANRSCSVLVATDVAARGLDIASLACVLNVDVTPDAEVHIHRIGRTGRAGETGLALNLASLDEMGAVGRIEQLQGKPSEWHPLAELTPAGGGPAGAAHGHAAHPGRPQGKDPPRRRAGRADQGPGLHARAGRQDRRQRVLHLCGRRARHRVVFHPLRNASGLHPMIAAIGVLLFLEAGAQAMWGADFQRMQTPYTGIVELGGVTAPAQRLLIIAARSRWWWCCTCSSPAP